MSKTGYAKASKLANLFDEIHAGSGTDILTCKGIGNCELAKALSADSRREHGNNSLRCTHPKFTGEKKIALRGFSPCPLGAERS